MNFKKAARMRRTRKLRLKLRELGATRLSVNRTPRHIYAQITAPDGSRVLASASTLETDFGKTGTGNAQAAALVGQRVAERGIAAGIKSVAFDRSGYKYHGRVKALAEAARKAGLKF
jgi:large subunit ribosomal protein L18